MTHIKGFKVRIYPNDEQNELLWKHVLCCRWFWNQLIDIQKFIMYIGGKYASAYTMGSFIPILKDCKEYEWTKDISRGSLQIVCRDLDNAYIRFFNGLSSFPKYKSRKKSKQSFPTRCDRFYIKDRKYLHIDKIGNIKYKTDRMFNLGRRKCKFLNVRVSFEDGKWYVSFGIECENQVPVLTGKSMGIDLGIKELATVANGDEEDGFIVFHNINKSQEIRVLKSRVVHTQRTISRKYEANKQGNKYVKTKNIEREEEKLRRLWHRIKGIRHNYIHQTTHKLISMRPSRVVMEDLNITGMMKNKYLSKSIGEMDWYMFRRQMHYKCDWNGIEFVLADRWYPSSKTCSRCGNKLKDLKLSDRTYVCPVCGAKLDRDYNAALNLSRYGEQVEEALQS